MAESTHRVEVVAVHPEPHPNADALEIVKVYGFTCCVRKGQFQPGELGAYVQPDSVVDSARPEFAFLAAPDKPAGSVRIKVRKLRGIVSMGLLIPAPKGAREGDDVAEALGVTHYEPPISAVSGGETEKPPPGYRPCYDVESFRRYAHVFESGEYVVVTEKIHGCNARFAFVDDRMRCGSRTEWKAPAESNLWWLALKHEPSIERWCRAHPGWTLYGEVFGQVQDLKYGVPKGGAPRFAAFDVLTSDGRWLDYMGAASTCDVPMVPLVKYGEAFDVERISALAEGPSLVTGADHLREGIVVRPIVERTHPEVGRVVLKVVSSAYLERP